MGELLLIGTGICGAKGMTLEGLEAAKSCSFLFAEQYTNLVPDGFLEELERLCGKKIALLSRMDVEGEKTLLDAAEKGSAALLVPGDPLIATTHVSLVVSARKRGVRARVVHSSSILSAAIGESGLQTYKFGKTSTLAYWRENYKPMAAYEAVAENLARRLHSLLLLDIDEQLGPMRPQTAAKTMLDMESAGKKGIFSGQTKVVLLQGLGWSCQKVSWLPLSQMLSLPPSGKDPPAAIIVPAGLHFMEEEFLSQLGKG
ncbi:MAG: diphthine synthase [Candidatus Micrarchaeota archaeon]|nr:diphthine synthase [Candidatus Micrarchaeota archaeon]